MNPFRKLGQLVNWVLGADLSEPAPPAPRPPAARPPAPRTPAPSGPDGFDPPKRVPLTWRTPFEPRAEPSAEEPLPEPPPVPPTAFMASLDDIDLVDEPLEPSPEFIPKGGMSTESLMREFDSLDPELVGAAVVELPPHDQRDASTVALMATLDVLTQELQERPLQVDVSPPEAPAAPGDGPPPGDMQPRVDGEAPVTLAAVLEVVSHEPPDVPLQRIDIGDPAGSANQTDAALLQPPVEAPVAKPATVRDEPAGSAVGAPTDSPTAAAKDDGSSG